MDKNFSRKYIMEDSEVSFETSFMAFIHVESFRRNLSQQSIKSSMYETYAAFPLHNFYTHGTDNLDNNM